MLISSSSPGLLATIRVNLLTDTLANTYFTNLNQNEWGLRQQKLGLR